MKKLLCALAFYAFSSVAMAAVNLNTASVEELKSLPGIGAATAQKIVEYREQNGAFKTPEDIQKIKGIGAKKFEKLKDEITVETEVKKEAAKKAPAAPKKAVPATK